MESTPNKVIEICNRAFQELGANPNKKDWTPYFREIAAERFIAIYEEENGNRLYPVGGVNGYVTTLCSSLVMFALEHGVETNIYNSAVKLVLSENDIYGSINHSYVLLDDETVSMILTGLDIYLSRGIPSNGKSH